MSNPRTLPRAVIATLAVVLGLAVLPFASAPAAADLPDQLVFDGRGWGHGRGLSQWGAQGYATKYGWTSAQILDHYYRGTTAGTAANETMRIRLRHAEGKDTRITVGTGGLSVTGLGTVTLPTDAKAIHLSRNGEGGFDVSAASTTTCADADFTPLGSTGPTDAVDVRPTVRYTGNASELLRLCTQYGDQGPGGTSIWYPDALRIHVADDAQQTVNITSIEQQLRSVVPSESPSSWAPAALEAQAVAARSYALAGDNRWTGANTCDTIYCQVYRGLFRLADGGPVPTTATSTDDAIKRTAGVVRRTSSGAIARTEFSSSSGGWTAGGQFPAVEDLGDVISPRHTWQCTVPTTLVESRWGNGGSLTGFKVTDRNGLGTWGGRVRSAVLTFDNGVEATVTGNQLRSGLNQGSCTDATGRTFSSGLLSDWFDLACIDEAVYVDAVHELFLGRSAVAADTERWCEPVRNGDRISLTRALSVSDEWAGVQISELYQEILGRTADASGRSYWLSQVERGLRIEDIAAQFYGSEEYYNAAGRTATGYVDALYVDLLGRPADDAGRNHWVGLLETGRMSRTQVAASFYGSIESRSDRVSALYAQILDRAPDPSGRAHWADQLRTLGDVALAAHLAASEEFYLRSLAG